MNITVNREAIKPITEVAASLMTKLAGRPCEVAGDMLGDQISFWRWTNRVRILEKAKKRLDDAKLDATELPPSFYFPFLEEAGNVDGDELQTLWANLLAKAVDNHSVCKRSLIEVLKCLSSVEAKLLIEAATGPLKIQLSIPSGPEITVDEPTKGIDYNELGIADHESLMTSLSFLSTNGCVLVNSKSRQTAVRNPDSDAFPFDSIGHVKICSITVWLTSFGASIIRACTDLDITEASIKPPWSLTDDAIEMALDAGQSGISQNEVQQMIDDSAPRFQ